MAWPPIITYPIPVVNGGTGTSNPSLIAGNQIGVSGTWPNQTVAVSATPSFTSLTLTDPLPIASGGTGTATPGLVAGNQIDVSGTWPNQTIAVSATPSFTSLTLTDPLPVASGGTGTATPGLVAGVGISLSGTWPDETVTNADDAYFTSGVLAVAHGGTGTATPGLVAGNQIGVSGTWPNQTVAVSATPSFTSLTGTGYLPSISNFNGIVQSSLNIMAYGATGSTTSVTATTTSGSTAATLSSAGDFQNGQHVTILHAGPATSLAQAATPTVVAYAERGGPAVEAGYNVWFQAEFSGQQCNTDSSVSAYHNANCTTSYTYQIVDIDALRGMSLPSAKTTITTGPAVLSAQNRLLVYWTQDANAAETVVCGCSGASCTPTPRAVIPNNIATTMTRAVNNFLTVSGTINAYWDMGNPYFAMDETYANACANTAAVNQNLNTTIASGGGTTSVTLAAAPSVSGSFAMWHDDAPPIQAAMAAACGPLSPTYNSPGTHEIYFPVGEYELGETVSLYNCPGVKLSCPGGAAALGAPSNCWFDWRGGGTMFDIERSWGTVIDGLTVLGAQTPTAGYSHGSTPATVFNFGETGTATVNTGGYTIGTAVGDTIGISSSTNIIKNTFLGAVGIGVSHNPATSDSFLGEKLYLENVQMATPPANGKIGGYIGLYTAGPNGVLSRVLDGMIGARTFGIVTNQGGALWIRNLNYESNVADLYAFDGQPASATIEEHHVWSEGAQHHFYSAPVFYDTPVVIEGSLLSPTNLNSMEVTGYTSSSISLLPNQFYIIPGIGGQTKIASNDFNNLESLIAIGANGNFTSRAYGGFVFSENNNYGSPGSPFYPAPPNSNPSGSTPNVVNGPQVTSINDFSTPVSQWFVNNPNNTLGGYTGSISGSMYTNNPGTPFASPITSLSINSLGPPGSCTATPEGTAGTTTHTYYVTAADAAQQQTAVSGGFSTSTANATLSNTNSVLLNCVPMTGIVQYCWWRDSTTTGFLGCSPGPAFNDVGQATTSQAAPTVTQQGRLQVNNGILLNAGIGQGQWYQSCANSVALASGAATVSMSCITGSRPITLTPVNDPNTVYVSAMSSGSLSLKSSSSTDASTVYWAQN